MMVEVSSSLRCGKHTLDLRRPQIIGILNVTPDSFSDGGMHFNQDQALRHAEKMVREGADMIDVGGESTRPGSAEVSVAAEIDRIAPVIASLHREFDLPVSIDTSKPEVMQAAVEAGAGMINDVYALRRDGALAMAARLNVAVCVMHMQGEPRSMQQAPHYEDVVREVYDFLHARVKACTDAGMDPALISVDPGFGFGKNLQHNMRLMRALNQFVGMSQALYIGFSRKRSIGQLTNKNKPSERVVGSVAAALLAVNQGARLVRVHDVAATKEALDVWQGVYAAA